MISHDAAMQIDTVNRLKTEKIIVFTEFFIVMFVQLLSLEIALVLTFVSQTFKLVLDFYSEASL